MRQSELHADGENPFEDVEPWREPVNGAILLSALKSTILRFCVLPEFSADIMAAWTLHAWTHQASDISPVLAFVSPEKRCGKTTALSVLAALTPRAMHNVNMTTSVLFRVVERYRPTVLIDEADTYLTDNEELRGVLNGGHNRLSAYVWRSVGDDHEPRRFNVWAPKCIAMIGKLPDTLEDRALVAPLRRKHSDESVERFRADRVEEFLPLRRKARRWAEDNMLRLRGIDPLVPELLNDRAQDNARAICAISDVAGGTWPRTIRAALSGLAAKMEDEPQSAGSLLLRDVAEILEARRGARIGSADLCTALGILEDSPWGEWRRGSPITTRGIAKLLEPFGIRPARDREGSFYRRADFADALERYVSEAPFETATSATSVTDAASATENQNENNGAWQNGTCGTCGEAKCDKRHGTTASETFEGEF